MTSIKKKLEAQLAEVEVHLQDIKSNPSRIVGEKEIHLEAVKANILIGLQKYERSDAPW